jgi:hypothetical protein
MCTNLHALPHRPDMGVLKYLQFYNLTCNDCGGAKSTRCINGTSCTLPVSNCTCAGGPSTVATVPNTTAASADGAAPAGDAAPAESPHPDSQGARRLAQAAVTEPPVCNYTQFS